jgi:hypothetical protein
MRDWLWSLGDDYVTRELSRTNTGSECSSSSMRRHSLKSSNDINEDIVSEKLVNVLLDDESLSALKPSSDDSNNGSMTDASQSSMTTGRARSSSSYRTMSSFEHLNIECSLSTEMKITRRSDDVKEVRALNVLQSSLLQAVSNSLLAAEYIQNLLVRTFGYSQISEGADLMLMTEGENHLKKGISFMLVESCNRFKTFLIDAVSVIAGALS